MPFTLRQPFANKPGVEAASLSHFAPLSPTFHHFYRNFTTTLQKKQHLFEKFFDYFSIIFRFLLVFPAESLGWSFLPHRRG